MIKKSFRLMLLVAFALSSVMFVACNKYDDDIERIDGELAALNATVQTLKAAVDGGAVISSVSNTAEGVKFTLSNGQSYVVNHGTVGKDGANGADGKDGQDGKPGSVVTIGENGNWHIDGVDQGVSATGASTFVVDCGSYYELNVLEKVEGENAEIVKINLPKTKVITNIDYVKVSGGLISNGNATALQMFYGATLAKDLKFNGTTYAKGTTLTSKNTVISAVINPLDADAALYDFVLVDTKGNSPFVVSKAEQNVSENPLTRADETANNGIWDMTVSYASGNFDADDVKDRAERAYALATTTANGMVASTYDIYLWENEVTNPSVTVSSYISDAKKRTINLSKVFSSLDHVVDYYFEIDDKTIATNLGAQLDGNTLTATTNGRLPMVAHYLLVDGTVNKASFYAGFDYIAPTGESLGSYTWTVQKDDGVKANGVEKEYYYLPIAAVKANLVGNNDTKLPGIRISAITWADGTELNKKSVVVNGAYYGKDVTDQTVTKINASDIATVDQYTYVWDEDAEDYVKATDINDELYVKVKFNSQTALVGDYTLTFDFIKNAADYANLQYYNATIQVPFNLSIVAPENVIVKNEPYFAGNNAVVYGVADGDKVTADLDDLFTTTGLAYTVTKIKETSSSKKATYSPWLGANGAITVPVKGDKNANYCVGTTQEFTASKTLFPRVAAATYTFNVTVTSPVVITYTGAAKTINEDPITIAVDEFTGKSLKTGDALYIGKIVADKTYNVDKVGHIKDVTVGVKADDYAKYIKISDNHTTFAEGTVTRKDANGKVVSTVDAVQVERVAGIAQQSPVTCTVNVTVKDLWGVSHVIPVAVTVNPLQ